MLKQHRTILSRNHEFLVSEVPVDPTLDAIRDKRILSWHDFDQLRTLRHQGRRALARYLLGVLPYRGAKAFDGFLESLQEANAQHIVDLLLEQRNIEVSHTPAVDEYGNPVTPSDTPLPEAGPDPHEYVIRLSRNNRLIREFVQPSEVSCVLTQNKVMSAREADMVLHLHGKNKKWDLVMAVLFQRGERAYQAFMAALLQYGYSSIFHTIQETSTDLDASEDEAEEYTHSPQSKRGNRSRKTNFSQENFNSDDLVESDEEIKAELTSRASTRDVDSFPDRFGSSNDADDALLRSSRDLQDINGTGNGTQNYPETDGRFSADTNFDSYFDDDDEGRNSVRSYTSRLRRNQRRKSNGSLPLNSVKEESEEQAVTGY